MSGGGVGDFMTDHGGQTGFCLSDRENACIDDNLSTGQAERVDLGIVDEADLPIEIGCGGTCLAGDPLGDPPASCG